MTYCSRNSKISLRLRQLDQTDLGGLRQLFLDDLVAELDALVADVDARPGDQLLDLLLRLAAEGTLEQIGPVPDTSHVGPLPRVALRPSGGASSVRHPAGCASSPIAHHPGRDVSRTHAVRQHASVTGVTCSDAAWPGPLARTRPGDRYGLGCTVVGTTPLRLASTWSTIPYSSACWAVRILSRSMSLRTSSMSRPVWCAMVSLEPLAHADDLVGVDLDVGRLRVAATLHRRLVDEHARVRQRQALARRARREQHRGGRRRLAEADRLDVRLDVLHRVVDRRHRRERATGRVDVHDDVAVRVRALEHEQLGHDVVGRGVVDLHAEEDDAVLEQLGVRVLALEAVGRALLELRQDVAAGGRRRREAAGCRPASRRGP